MDYSQEPTRLYLITPPTICDVTVFADTFQHACDGGDVGSLQLRLKDADDDAIRHAAEILLPLCQEREIAFILNDNPALALAVDADGVHLGQDDISVKEARIILGDDRIIGASCYNSRDCAMSAGGDGADYVAFGAFYPSPTKTPPALADQDILSWWYEWATLPSVAIGGITPENCRPLVEAGADFIASVSGVWNHPDGPKASVIAFNRVFAEVNAQHKA